MGWWACPPACEGWCCCVRWVVCSCVCVLSVLEAVLCSVVVFWVACRRRLGVVRLGRVVGWGEKMCDGCMWWSVG